MTYKVKLSVTLQDALLDCSKKKKQKAEKQKQILYNKYKVFWNVMFKYAKVYSTNWWI